LTSGGFDGLNGTQTASLIKPRSRLELDAVRCRLQTVFNLALRSLLVGEVVQAVAVLAHDRPRDRVHRLRQMVAAVPSVADGALVATAILPEAGELPPVHSVNPIGRPASSHNRREQA